VKDAREMVEQFRALGCTRAALAPPRTLTPVLITAAAAAAVTVTAGLTSPHPMRPFLVALTATAGLAATITLARSKKPTPPVKTAITAIAAGAALNIATALYLLGIVGAAITQAGQAFRQEYART